ncbi:hypothetical protein LOTGIDRAFT_119569 [Lottia gigantea]|uniref:Interleukin-1 receptor-associated kinase 1-binding protein 1 n=1 Tax=Lottia gigantea TaxID=225164 RepID=V4BW21_LOTGI|nr:hypothetical protein LOTGIDRAFT_119569 [Lottia gigantea]ESO93274.1 hypothetical protein LOTGIDRAFT_119569 [Lottia gigantea]
MVFTKLQSNSLNANRVQHEDENVEITPTATDRHIRVSAVGEAILRPNKCKISISVTGRKEEAQEAKSSVSRRVEYIKQCLFNYGITSENVDIFERLMREGKLVIMKCDITAVFTDFNKCQEFSNLVIEKLDQNVQVSLPEFQHDDKFIESLRKEASLLAIHNAKLKAQEMAKLVHLDVGRPISIQEEETTESTPPGDLADSVHQRKLDATMTVTSKISVLFELKKRSKKK